MISYISSLGGFLPPLEDSYYLPMAFCYVNGIQSMSKASVKAVLAIPSKTVIFFRNSYELNTAYFTQVTLKYLFRSWNIGNTNFPCIVGLGISDDTTNTTSLGTINIEIEMARGKDKQYTIDLTSITKSNILSKRYIFVSFQCNVLALYVVHPMDFAELHMRFREGGKFNIASYMT